MSLSREPLVEPPTSARSRGRNRAVVVALVATIVGTFAGLAWFARPAPTRAFPVTLVEHAVRPITLPEFAALRDVEYSGATPWGDEILLLPQYPDRVASGGALLAVRTDELLWWLRHADEALELGVRTVAFDDDEVVARVAGFEGYEAVVELGDELWFAIEARRGVSRMEAWLVPGTWTADRAGIRLDAERMIELPDQSGISNKAYEALTLCDGRLVALYELASPSFVPEGAVAYVIDPASGAMERWPVPELAFRLTDATLPDAAGVFWVMNYAWPGDRALAADRDRLAERWGIGGTHARTDAVERLVPWRCGDGRIEAVDRPPILLEMTPREARNWEALVRLDEGWLLATDRFPRTIVGWLPASAGEEGSGDSGGER